MTMIRNLLCFIGWHRWDFSKPDSLERQCQYCIKHEYLHGTESPYLHWCGKSPT